MPDNRRGCHGEVPCAVLRGERLLGLAKNLLFTGCLRDADRYFAAKARVMVAASRLGVYERAYMRLLPAFVRRGSDAIDVGANFGAYTHILSRMVGPAGRLFSFEPIPEVARCLEESSRPLGNVTVIREILSDRAGSSELLVPRLPGGVPEPALARVVEATDPGRPAGTWKVLRVQAQRLDDHLERFRNVSFIKVDVEGHEAAFLAGAGRTIATFRPVLQVEAAGVRRHESAVRAWAETADYTICSLRGGQLAPAPPGGLSSLNVYLLPRHALSALPAGLVRGTDVRT